MTEKLEISKSELRNEIEKSKELIRISQYTEAANILNLCIEKASSHILHEIEVEKSVENQDFFYYDILSVSYNLLGVVYQRENRIVKSMVNYINCIITLDSSENLELRSKVYNNIGTSYYSIKDYEKAKIYYEKSLEIDESVDYEYNSGLVMIKLTQTLYKMGYIDEAFGLVRKMLLILCEDEYSNVAIGTYSIAALIFNEMGYVEEAIQYHKKAKKAILNSKDSWGKKENIVLNLEYLVKNERYTDAGIFIDLLYKNTLNQNSGSQDIKFCHMASKIYDKVGDTEKSKYFLMKYREFSKRVLEDMKTNELTGVEASNIIYQLKSNNEKLKQMAETDTLTGVGNKGMARKYLEDAIKDALEADTKVGLIIIDIDNFKMLNDKYGHIVGDKCIKVLGTILKKLSYGDYIQSARFGGDEFFVIVKNANKFQLRSIAEEIAIEIEGYTMENGELKDLPVTLSQGLFVGRPYSDDNYMSYVKKADIALYKAKEHKNTIEFYFE